VCPKCHSDFTIVTDNGMPLEGEIKRTRKCLGCGAYFQTIERSVLADTVNNFKAQMRGIVR
jgi:transcriptional regulator NrdR family protein